MDKYFLSYNIFREENSSGPNPYKKDSSAIVIVVINPYKSAQKSNCTGFLLVRVLDGFITDEFSSRKMLYLKTYLSMCGQTLHTSTYIVSPDLLRSSALYEQMPLQKLSITIIF